LRELRRVAEAATPGPWRAGGRKFKTVAEIVAVLEDMVRSGGLELYFVVLEEDRSTAVAVTGNGPTSDANARYIAAFDPPTVLAMLDALDEQERRSSGDESEEDHCPECRGYGRDWDGAPCDECRGTGRVVLLEGGGGE